VVDKNEIEAFLFKEARLIDEYRYDDWESLWTDDGNYWVPANGDSNDTHKKVSIINDNRARIRSRIVRLKSDVAHSQDPKSRIVRLISNIEFTEQADDEILVYSSFFLAESRPHRDSTWIGRTEHRLVRKDGGLQMKQKKVMLVNNNKELPSLGFLL